MTNPTPPGPVDPVRFCAMTTVALLAWLLSPAVVLAAMAGLGLWAYARARRRGLTQSRCVLGDPRLVLVYLGAAFFLGSVLSIRALISVLPPIR